jgi:hypothetical protein
VRLVAMAAICRCKADREYNNIGDKETSMTRILLDPSLRTKLPDLSQPLEFCDENGALLGIFTPVATLQPRVSDEELDHRDADAESYSTSEVIAHLEQL